MSTPDGKRVFWSNGIDRIVKIDHDSWELIDEYIFPGVTVYSEARADESIRQFEQSNDGIVSIYRTFSEMNKLRDLANLYTLLGSDHTYYSAVKPGL